MPHTPENPKITPFRRRASLWLVIPATVLTTALGVYGFMTLTESEAKTEVVAKTEKTEPIEIEDEPVEPVETEAEPETESVEEMEAEPETEPETEAGDSALVIENQPDTTDANVDTTGIPFNPTLFDDIAGREQLVEDTLKSGVFFEPEDEIVFVLDTLVFTLSLQVDNAASVEYEANSPLEDYRRLYLYVVSELFDYYKYKQFAAIGDWHELPKEMPSSIDVLRERLKELGTSYHYDQIH